MSHKTSFVGSAEYTAPSQSGTKHLANLGKPAIEILAVGTYTVMPPSIHPSGIAYHYVGCNPLYEYAFDELPELTPEMVLAMELVIKSQHTQIILGGEGTHDAALALVGQLVAGGVSRELILKSVPALFPEGYKGNSLEELPGMVESAFEKGFHKAAANTAMDTRIASQLVNELKPFIFVKEEGFLKYESGHWQPYPNERFEALALHAIGSYAGKLASSWIRPVKKCAELSVIIEGFGKFSNLICCQNGTLNVLTGELLPWSPDHQLRYQLGFNYDPDANCHLYEAHLRQTLQNDEEAINLFDEFGAYTLIPDNRMQKAVYLIGPGGGGKSTLLKAMIAMHDPRAVSVTSLTKIDDERHITDLATKLLCMSMDIQPKHNAAAYGEGFVRITGGDPVTTRRLYQEVQGNVQTSVRFMGSMNQLPPKYIAAPDALKRRLIFLPCAGKIENPDPDFMNKLLAERPGILARWARALQRLMERGHFIIPESSKLLVDEYLDTQDPVQCFLDECSIQDSTAQTSVEELFTSYRVWSEMNNERPMGKNIFGKHLHACGLKVHYTKTPDPETGDPKTTRVYSIRLVGKFKPLCLEY